MKIRIAHLLMLTVYLALASCSSNTNDQDTHEHSDGHDHEEHSEVPANKDGISSSIGMPEIKLNNGEKWEANPETTEGIMNMKMVIEEYSKQPASTREYYQGLAQKLAGYFDGIIQNCTMKGEAHEQLHNYLIPMKPYLEKIGSGDAKTAEEAKSVLTKYLTLYDNYFK